MEQLIGEEARWRSDVYTPPSKFYEYLLKLDIVDKIEARGSKFIFKCPLCKDYKKRAYLLTSDDGKATIGCHNCDEKFPFSTFLKQYHPNIHKEWIRDVYVGIDFDSVNKISFVELDNTQQNAEIVDYSKFIPLKNKRDSIIRNLSLEFIEKRKIPKKFAKKFLYCEEGRYSNRIIMPHVNRDGSYIHFEARDLNEDSPVKYLYPYEWTDNYHNLPNIKKNKDYFIFEGVVDSYFLENTTASRGIKKINNVLATIHKSLRKNAIIFGDGDRDGLVGTYKFLQKGYRVVKWTKEMMAFGKDLNKLVMNGFFKQDDFNSDGQIKTEVIMKYVIKPDLGEMMLFKMEALEMGIEI